MPPSSRSKRINKKSSIMKNLQNIIDKIDEKNSVHELKKFFQSEITKLGYTDFDAFSYQANTMNNLRQDGNYYIASYGLEYLEKFIDKGLINTCPVTEQISHSSFPFDYIKALETHKSNWSIQFQYRLMKLFNIHYAWIIPFNTIDRVKGMTLYTQGKSESVKKQFFKTQHEAQLLANSFLKKLENLDPTTATIKKLTNKSWNKNTLSLREIECIKHCSNGLTYAEIGQKLNISENTIRFHMKNIFRKMDVSSRSKAVALYKSNL